MLDWLYPWTCSLCGLATGNGSSLCNICRQRLVPLEKPICLYCGEPARPEAAAGCCDACAHEERAFDFARSALADTEENHRLILDLKYHQADYLAPALASFLDALWEECSLLHQWGDWALLPVPTNEKRLQKRGYNQAEELARALGKRRNLRCIQPLERTRGDHVSQTALDARERDMHARSIYRMQRGWETGRKRIPAHILLIDDVYTTGATLRACARLLKTRPEVRTVGALTVLRASRPDRSRP